MPAEGIQPNPSKSKQIQVEDFAGDCGLFHGVEGRAADGWNLRCPDGGEWL
jgi:hypothetical protein